IRKGLMLALFSVTFSVAFAQHGDCTLKISRRVTDSDTGLPLSGVTVNADPGTIQAISDAHGYFQLTHLCRGTNYSIAASSVGFDRTYTQLTLQADTELAIVLHHGTIKLHDVE